ncbi:hypothetical protein B0J12DRAFT_698679 [Macrophomina phaseolina]|uniref:Zn(2)-C6 fungal-type domain-containing protein n=1 Tax=Macrophomina phaseolina TaxID=35725 RepID=A0ABQ8GEX4_9PEZI|nr:hypothetical protein B0J12DRAFT_698679 [Macrophomina phaseolina]
MSVSIRPRHQQQPPQQHHQEQSQPSSQHGHQRPAAAVDGGEPALLPPPPPGTRGRPEPGLSRRPKSTQSKRSIITHVACQPCQRRKHKCDGQRPVCTSCLAKSRDDCAYDATGDQRRTTALKTRIQDLRRQAEDLKDIVRGIVAAPDHEAAFATARMLVAEGFTHTADIANAFRTEQANEESVSEQRDWAHDVFLADSLVVAHPPALYSYPTTSDPAMANATFQHDGAGGMPFPPLSFQRQEEPLELIQSDYENMPIEVRTPGPVFFSREGWRA